MSGQGIPKEELGATVSTIGTMRKTPMILYGMFVEVARQIYSPAMQPNGKHWDPDPSKSKIWIDAEYEWSHSEAAPNFRPGIYISLSELTYATYTGNDRGLERVNLKEGEYDYGRSGKGAVSWVHVGNTKGEGVLLSEITHDFISAFADPIRQEFCFTKFFVQKHDPCKVVKEDREKFRSVVTAYMEWSDNWTLKLESPKLKEIVFSAGQQALDVLGSGA